MFDFPQREIKVRYYSQDYGPHQFNMKDALPSGVALATVSVRTFLGKIKPGEDLSAATETTDELIDVIKTLVADSETISVYFNYPTTAAYIGQKHTLILEVTMDNGSKHPYYFYSVTVE